MQVVEGTCRCGREHEVRIGRNDRGVYIHCRCGRRPWLWSESREVGWHRRARIPVDKMQYKGDTGGFGVSV